MKKIFSLLVLSCLVLASHAQDIYICKDGDYIKTTLSEGLSIDFNETPDSITFTKPALPIVVEVVYNGTEATVTIPKCMKDSVTCTRVNGSNSYVFLEYKGSSDEIIYDVKGSSDNGSLIIKSDYKMQVNLNNVSLTSTCGEALRFKCGKRIALVMADGSVNTFMDSKDKGVTPDPLDSHKACIYTKGHLELSGAGTLNVTGNYNHALAAKEYLKVKKSVKAINILGAAGDAIHVGEYFTMNGGKLTIGEGTKGDGVQVEYKTDDDGARVKDEENTGEIIINDGTLDITMVASEDTKCMKADGNVTINGGTLLLHAMANGSRGIQSDGTLTIAQAEGVTTDITIDAAGGKCTLSSDKEDPDKCMGINVEGDINMSAGTLNITASGASANGLKCDRNLTVSGG
ncbi:MAG: carbohydrate-binding domain-containing protein, partial [Bacteroidaceae bacterium]|nr:carbohydrate-binding domain-containing protein [Bacteroidaceae bacterium]